MIFLIDIVILGFITYFSITKSIKSDPLTEVAKLASIITAMLGAIFIYPKLLQNIILNLSSSLFSINKNQMDIDFFYMISFMIQFFIIYSIASSIFNYLKNSKGKKIESTIGKVSIVLPCIIRSILIVIIIIYSIESFPNDISQSKNMLQKSTSYKTLSKISHIIIQ